MAMQGISYVVKNDSISLVVDGNPFTVSKGSHRHYDRIIKAIKENDADTVRKFVDTTKVITEYTSGKLSIQSGHAYWGELKLASALSNRMLTMFDQGFEITIFENFIAALMENPSKRAVDELYTFLDGNDLPLSDDGRFLAYKRVVMCEDVTSPLFGKLVDKYTGKIDNSVGTHPAMQRNQVDDNYGNTCSEGLHFCSLGYLIGSGYASGGVIVIVAINPRDVVAIPSDYNRQKGRCCEYEVLGVYGTDHNKELFDKSVKRIEDIKKELAEKNEQPGPDISTEKS